VNPEKKLVIEIITEAFLENRSVNFVIRQDDKRTQRIESLVKYSYNLCKKDGEVYCHDHTVALINYPHTKRKLFFSMIQDIQLVINVIGLKNLSNVLRRESLIKRNHPKSPFCHLWYIGVAKQFQHMGRGTKLLKEIIAKHDKLGLPIYLETSVEENVSWYMKNGFQVYKEVKDFGFTTFLMRRE